MANKKITPDDFQKPETVTSPREGVKDPVVEETGLKALADVVAKQSSLIERLQEKLDLLEKAPKPVSEMTRQEELRRIDQASKTQKQLLVEKLNSQPKVTFMIPLGINEKKGATHEVGINGVVFVYPKGQMIQVPQTVFELLRASYDITVAAGEDLRIDRADDINDALV